MVLFSTILSFMVVKSSLAKMSETRNRCKRSILASNSKSAIIIETLKNVERDRGAIQLNTGIDKRLFIRVM